MQQDGSVSKGTCSQAWQPELNPWNTRGGRREPTSARTSDFDMTLELNNQQHHGASLHRTLSWQPPDVGALGTHFIDEDSKR